MAQAVPTSRVIKLGVFEVDLDKVALRKNGVRLSRNFLIDDSGRGWGELQAESSRLLSEELDLLLAVSLFIIFSTFVDVLLAIFQHAIDQSSQAMSHGGNSFGSTESAAQSSILRTEVGLAS